jgi:hypothetical protein
MHEAPRLEGGNLLLESIQYAWTQTPSGAWRRYMYADGSQFAEYTSNTQVGGIPLLHITWGRSPETGRRVHAVGIVAIGRRATGAIAIGQMAVGLIAIGQLGVAIGVGQAATGIVGLGQAVLAAYAGIGQAVYSGYVAIAQIGMAEYVLAQIGHGAHVIDMRGVDPLAKEFFLRLVRW